MTDFFPPVNADGFLPGHFFGEGRRDAAVWVRFCIVFRVVQAARSEPLPRRAVFAAGNADSMPSESLRGGAWSAFLDIAGWSAPAAPWSP
jgi:hypothetical protein